jgi:ATP-binding cassette subfamily B protein
VTEVALNTIEPPVASAAPDAPSSIQALLLLAGGQKALLAGAIGGAIASVALGLVPYFCIASMAAPSFAVPPDIAAVKHLAQLAALAVVSRYVCIAISSMLAHTAAYRILYDLRLRLADKLGKVPLRFYASTTTAELKQRVLDDVQQIEGFVAHHLTEGVAAITVPVATLLALLVIDWRMALASVAVAPVAVLAMALGTRGVETMHRDWFARQDRTNQAALEFLRGIQVVKTFGVSTRHMAGLADSIADNTRWVAKLMRQNGKAFAVFQTLVMSSWLVLVPVGGYLFLEGSLAMSTLVLFLVLGPQILGGATRLGYAFENMKKIGEGTTRVLTLLTTPERAQPSVTETPAGHGITFHDVSLEYREGRSALSNVSFEAPQGLTTAIVGRSGAGKSSVARLIANLWDASSGSVRVGGADVKQLSPERLLGLVSIAQQEVYLFRGTVEDNLRIAKPSATSAEIAAACRAAQAHGFISSLPDGFQTKLGERGVRLSGGEKQRLALARALLKDAPILILDEATSAADADNEALIADALASTRRGRTVIVIAHRLASVAGADNIIVLDQGRIVEQGKHANLLMAGGAYAKLWQDQADAKRWRLERSSSLGAVAC